MIRVIQSVLVNRSRVKLYLKLKMVISRVLELELNQNVLSLVKLDIFLNHLILQLLIRNILSRVLPVNNGVAKPIILYVLQSTAHL